MFSYKHCKLIRQLMTNLYLIIHNPWYGKAEKQKKTTKGFIMLHYLFGKCCCIGMFHITRAVEAHLRFSYFLFCFVTLIDMFPANHINCDIRCALLSLCTTLWTRQDYPDIHWVHAAKIFWETIYLYSIDIVCYLY